MCGVSDAAGRPRGESYSPRGLPAVSRRSRTHVHSSVRGPRTNWFPLLWSSPRPCEPPFSRSGLGLEPLNFAVGWGSLFGKKFAVGGAKPARIGGDLSSLSQLAWLTRSKDRSCLGWLAPLSQALRERLEPLSLDGFPKASFFSSTETRDALTS